MSICSTVINYFPLYFSRQSAPGPQLTPAQRHNIERRKKAIEVRGQVYADIAHYTSPRVMMRIWEKSPEDQEIALQYMMLTIESLRSKNAYDLDRMIPRGRAVSDPVYKARDEAMRLFEEKVVTRYENAYGDLSRFRIVPKGSYN